MKFSLSRRWSIIVRGSAVHCSAAADHLPADVRRQVAGQEERHLGHVFHRATAPQRDGLYPGLAHLLGHGRSHVGDDESGGYAVGANAAGAHLLGDGLGKPYETGLGGRVVGLTGIAVLAHNGTHVDDASAALLRHHRHYRVGEVEGRLEVHVDDGVPLLLFHAEHQAVLRDAGVVHQHVNAAEVGNYLIHNAVRGGEVGRVGFVGLDLYAQGLQFSHRVGVYADVGESYVSTLGCELQGYGLSYAL